MNSDLHRLQPYPFERLQTLFQDLPAEHALSPIRLSIGEPQHATPALIIDALHQHISGLAVYPKTSGTEAFRSCCAQWLQRRYALKNIDPHSQILPVNGSREALFAFAQSQIDRQRSPYPKVLMPNPFYQIYEGAALLAGATPVFLNQNEDSGFQYHFANIDDALWRDIQVVYVCSPGNPCGQVMTLAEWKTLFDYADRFDFVIAADECYSEIYFDEGQPPLGALEAAQALGRDNYRKLLSFTSLSKRSNVPGLRSGFVAGDAQLVASFLRYRTYHGCAMSPLVQAASVAAWSDETHVVDNRLLYREKFAEVMPILSPWLSFTAPQAGFYLWAKTPLSDTVFARNLQQACNVTVLPGSFLARETPQGNPGERFIRTALVAPLAQCRDAAQRIAEFCATQTHNAN